jgi:hypothetical protein
VAGAADRSVAAVDDTLDGAVLAKAVRQLKQQWGKGLAGHGPTLFAGLTKRVDLKLVSRLEFGSGAVALRYEQRAAA